MSRLTMNEAVEYLKGVGFKDSASAPFYPFYEDGSEYKKALDILVKELQRYKDLEEQGRLIEQKHGRWTLADSDVDWYLLECSVCKHQITAYGGSNLAKYCPNCGAKMDEVEE